MKKSDIINGHVYAVKLSGRLSAVRIIGDGGRFVGVNLRTNRKVGPWTAAKLRFELQYDDTKKKWCRVLSQMPTLPPSAPEGNGFDDINTAHDDV